jgi:hypothetical protein
VKRFGLLVGMAAVFAAGAFAGWTALMVVSFRASKTQAAVDWAVDRG